MALKWSDVSFDANKVLRSEFLKTARLAERLRWLLLRRATGKRQVQLFGRLNALDEKARRFEHRVRTVESTAPCRWLPVGPRNVNGRIRCLAIHPTNDDVVYAGAADGGVWKTVDRGQSWTPLTDDKDSLSIGSLAIDPTAPDTIYAGTGEPLRASDVSDYGWAYPGIGVLQSTDGGMTWNAIGAIQNQYIYRIAVDPHDPANLLCAGFAIDGNGGLCRWDAAMSVWEVKERGTFTDVVFDPANPGVAYAGKFDGGIWKSIDSGNTWGVRSSGLGGAGRVSVTIARQRPSVLYARVESTGLVYQTTSGAEPAASGGNAWAVLPAPGADVGPGGIAVNQRYWCSYVAADPMDAAGEVVYVGGVDLARGERNALGQWIWTRISWNYDPPNGLGATHADQHDIAFMPSDSTQFYVATDGGVFRGAYTAGALQPAQWHKVSTGLAVTQFYDLATSATTPSMFGGGCQDNGTLVTTGGLSWRHVYGGDGSYLAFHSTDPRTIWAVRWDQGAIVQRSKDGGATFADAQGAAPNRITGGGEIPVVILAMDPSNPATLFVGTDRIWRTTNGDTVPAANVAWSDRIGGAGIGTVSEISIASPTVTYVGTMDGHLHVSRDGGATFSNITPPVANWPARWLSGITLGPGPTPTMYVTFHGFRDPADAPDHIWKGVFDPTAGPTGSWTTAMAPISSGLSNAPVGALVVDRVTPTTLYAATEVGVYRSVDDGVSWNPFGDGLPNAPVIDLALHPTLPLLRAATHGRGMFQLSLNASCPDVDLYLRDNLVDTGEVLPSPSGVPDPTRLNEHVYHWQSADIKVDAPPFQIVDALTDGVEFDNPTHRLLPFGYRIESVDGITHENPIRSVVNRVYVQAHNRGWKPAVSVDVRLLWSDAGAGLPPLPADFWSGFAGDTYTQTVWHLIGKQRISALAPGVPHVLRFDWTPPATTSDHVCLLALLDSPDERLLPETELNVDVLTPHNKRVTHKNVHPVDAVLLGGRLVAWPWLRFHNASSTARRFTFRLQTSAHRDWTVALLLPRVDLPGRLAECVNGFQPLSLDHARLEAWLAEAEASGALSAPLLQLRPQFDEPIVLAVEAAEIADLRGVLVQPDRPVPAVFIASRPRAARPAPLRLDVLQLDGEECVGGSTFLIA